MNAQQNVLPFHHNRSQRRKKSNLDLLGRFYMEDHVRVTVVAECGDNDKYVLVQRQPGKTSPMLAWLMRLIFEEEDKKLRRAA